MIPMHKYGHRPGGASAAPTRRRGLSSPWVWTLAVSAVLAVIVAAAGTFVSRHEERIPERPEGNRVDDHFRETVRRIDQLEVLWEAALDEEAGRLLEGGFRHTESGTVISGVVQKSFLNP